jgi:hypothetical protein
MLLEQVLLSHNVIGQLHARAASAPTPEAAGIYHAAAARLMHEFGKMVSTFKNYRAPVLIQVEDEDDTGQGSKQRPRRRGDTRQSA